MNVAIVGSGVVGFAVGKGFSKLGNNVLFYDINNSRVETIKKMGFNATGAISDTISADVLFICVPTPTKNFEIDLGAIKSSVMEIGRTFSKRKDYFLVVAKSTVVPTTSEKVLLPLLEKCSGKKAGKDFGYCNNPEFLREKFACEDFMSPDRVVIGEYDKKSGDILAELHKSFECPVIRTDLRTAEMIKYANNCFYAAKISFFNEIHLICRKFGIDSSLVRKTVQMDKFYSIHPWFHGKPFGGICLPKDLGALIGLCNHGGIHDPVMLKSVWEVNQAIKTLEEEKMHQAQSPAE